MQEAPAISPTLTIVWVLIGIIISLLLPVAVRVLREARPAGLEERGLKSSFSDRLAAAWRRYGGNRYVKILLAATLVAIVLVFLLGLKFSAPRDAALAGFAWESLINKLLGRNGS